MRKKSDKNCKKKKKTGKSGKINWCVKGKN